LANKTGGKGGKRKLCQEGRLELVKQSEKLANRNKNKKSYQNGRKRKWQERKNITQCNEY